MIARLQGILFAKKPPDLLLNVAGVGYELQAPLSTFYRLPNIGTEVTLYTHLVVREDAHLLFGFAQEQEQILFRTLIKVSGVGPKLALTILSGMEPDAFAKCIQENDVDTLVRLPGVGKKTAARLLIEMRDRLADWQNYLLDISLAPPLPTPQNSATQDAISALITLGYKPQDAKRAVLSLALPQASSEQLIRAALQNIIKGTTHVDAGSLS